VCPREIIPRKTDRGNRESKEEPLIRGGALRGWDSAARCPY
jgi:hypothetical protein